ncbi:MAG: PilZ domain-containing protein [Phycisphaerales bacterium JB061]
MASGDQNQKGFDDWAHTLLNELEQQTPEAIRKQRATERHEIRCGVNLKPGNASDVHKPTIEAVTGDVSSGGCQVMSSQPLCVGDVYKLEFEKGELDLPTIYARCLRCRLVREDAFESGFAFFTPVKLEEMKTADSIMDSLI